MIQTILAFFGYCKIPKETVPISMASENVLIALLKQCDEGKVVQNTADYIRTVLKGQKALTEFLRTGRSLQ